MNNLCSANMNSCYKCTGSYIFVFKDASCKNRHSNGFCLMWVPIYCCWDEKYQRQDFLEKKSRSELEMGFHLRFGSTHASEARLNVEKVWALTWDRHQRQGFEGGVRDRERLWHVIDGGGRRIGRPRQALFPNQPTPITRWWVASLGMEVGVRGGCLIYVKSLEFLLKNLDQIPKITGHTGDGGEGGFRCPLSKPLYLNCNVAYLHIAYHVNWHI